MIKTFAVAGYRSLRELILPLGSLNLVTGPNGSGKSNLYRGLRLVCETAQGTAHQTIAAEGGLESVLWAGPEQASRSVRRGEEPVQGGPRKKRVALRLSFSGEDLGFAIDFGLPPPSAKTLFNHDPEIKREVIWHGDSWHERRALVDRRGAVVRARDEAGEWSVIEQNLQPFDSMLAQLADPERTPENLLMRRTLRSGRFYDHFRSDSGSPARQPQIGTRTPALSNDGHDLAAAWQTIREIGDAAGLDLAVSDAFPGAEVRVQVLGDRFQLEFLQHGLLRPLSQAELSDGTLRYLRWIAALHTPRPPSMMVLNEPETSLHPELLPALGPLMKKCAKKTQLWVVSHAAGLIDTLGPSESVNHIRLDKELGETHALDQDRFSTPPWRWPAR